MKLKPWLYHSHIHLYQNQSMILRKFVKMLKPELPACLQFAGKPMT